MGYALPPELVMDSRDIGNINELAALVESEIKELKSDYQAAVAFRGRTTVGASELSIDQFTPYICEFIRGNIPESPRKGMSPSSWPRIWKHIIRKHVLIATRLTILS